MKPPTELWTACLLGDANKVKQLLREGHAVDEVDECGRAALWVACRYGEYKIAEILIDHGASIHRVTKELGTPLILRACGDSWRHVEVVRLLIKRGVDVNQKDAKGWTPLMFACMARNKPLVKLLLENNAARDVTVGDGLVPPGTTAADLARLSQCEDIAEMVECA